jgi:DNA uptake protein ComE-like DNA-binding protein
LPLKIIINSNNKRITFSSIENIKNIENIDKDTVEKLKLFINILAF